MTEWISVKDRLPAFQTGNTSLRIICIDITSEYKPVFDAFYDDICKCWITYPDVSKKNVTHWMPLPNLPEEK